MSDYKFALGDISEINKKINIALVVGEFNREYTKQLEEKNIEFFKNLGFKHIDSFLVPGVFEIPGFTKKILEEDKYDLILCLGVVIRGETPHFDYVCNESSRGIMNLTLEYDTPIIFGILTCENQKQVESRIGDNFAISGLNLLSEIEKI